MQFSEHCSADTKEFQNAQYILPPIQVAGSSSGCSVELMPLEHAKWTLPLQLSHYSGIEDEKHHFGSARLELHVKRSYPSLLLLEALVLAKMHRNDQVILEVTWKQQLGGGHKFTVLVGCH